jgi:hypothetical protein
MVFNTSACPLDDLVLERRNPERSLPPIGFGMNTLRDGLPVAPTVDPGT